MKRKQFYFETIFEVFVLSNNFSFLSLNCPNIFCHMLAGIRTNFDVPLLQYVRGTLLESFLNFRGNLYYLKVEGNLFETDKKKYQILQNIIIL